MLTKATMNRRLWALGLALLLAALATAALLSYVRGVERRSVEGSQGVSVLVARESIAAGTTAETASAQGLLGRVSVPRRLLPDGAVTSLQQIQGKVAAFPITKGEQIVTARFVAATQVNGALPIPADRQALSIEVDLPAGVGGFVRPGNRISLIAKFDVTAPGGSKVSRAKYIVQDVPVLAVGARVLAVPGTTTEDSSGNGPAEDTAQGKDRVQLTLAVLPSDAEKITLAVYSGELEATLLPPGQKPVTTFGRTPENIFN